jgi:AraC-like DNA-binding protein
MAELVRAATLSGYFEIARELRVDSIALLRTAGLSRALLLNPEQMIPAEAVVDLLEATAEAANCPTVALRMAERRNLADLGRISLLIAHQGTLREAIDVLSHYRNSINSTLVLHTEEIDDIAILREDFALKTSAASRQANDLALGVLARTCATILGPQWRPEQVCFTYPAPPAQDREVYRRLFQCPISFSAEFNGIVLNANDLDRRNPRADVALAVHARSLLDSVMFNDVRTIVQEVEQTILLLLPSGRASIKACADALGMNLRTMQRQLEDAGTSFSSILDDIRRQQVARYFTTPKLRLTDVADLLGYGSLGAFNRWYTKAFGESPSHAMRKVRLHSRALSSH